MKRIETGAGPEINAGIITTQTVEGLRAPQQAMSCSLTEKLALFHSTAYLSQEDTGTNRRPRGQWRRQCWLGVEKEISEGKSDIPGAQCPESPSSSLQDGLESNPTAVPSCFSGLLPAQPLLSCESCQYRNEVPVTALNKSMHSQEAVKGEASLTCLLARTITGDSAGTAAESTDTTALHKTHSCQDGNHHFSPEPVPGYSGLRDTPDTNTPGQGLLM